MYLLGRPSRATSNLATAQVEERICGRQVTVFGRSKRLSEPVLSDHRGVLFGLTMKYRNGSLNLILTVMHNNLFCIQRRIRSVLEVRGTHA